MGIFTDLVAVHEFLDLVVLILIEYAQLSVLRVHEGQSSELRVPSRLVVSRHINFALPVAIQARLYPLETKVSTAMKNDLENDRLTSTMVASSCR